MTADTSAARLASTLPTRSFDELWHVGTLNARDKGSRSESLEGSGLSVSVHPDQWTRIARLSPSPTWRLTRAGNQFVDLHNVTADQRADTSRWAVDHGWAERTTLWRLRYFDYDLDEVTDMHVAGHDYEHARAELDHLAYADNDTATLTQLPGLRATSKLRNRMRNSCPPGLTEQFTLLLLAVTHGSFDGMWWADTYEPPALSCPRGVIDETKLTRWTITRC